MKCALPRAPTSLQCDTGYLEDPMNPKKDYSSIGYTVPILKLGFIWFPRLGALA